MIEWQDLVNALFLFGAILFMGLNINQLYKDKLVRGVSAWPFIYFLSWNFYSLYYLVHLNQLVSFVLEFGFIAVSLFYVGQILHYQRVEKQLMRINQNK
ncbi:MAG: hypothetical protein ABGY08_09005 [Gammaproteobacteria bacterium]